MGTQIKNIEQFINGSEAPSATTIGLTVGTWFCIVAVMVVIVRYARARLEKSKAERGENLLSDVSNGTHPSTA